tara:strand:- start:4249 stop:5367 length:1119 start_codon:yes stop_codon:yes gene_type:complete
MIQDHNLNVPEQEYRDLELPSYSMIASISKHGVDVVNGIKTGGFVLKFGSLVDDMVFNTTVLNSKYYAGQAPKNPTTNVKNIVDLVLDSIDSPVGSVNTTQSLLGSKRSQTVTDKLEDYNSDIESAALKLGVYQNYTRSKMLKTVIDAGQEYFKDRLHARGKILIKPEMWALAYETAQTLITHSFSSKYFDQNQPGIELIYQYKFIAEVRGFKCKGMLDCVMIDHNEKKIYPIDLKTGESPAEKFNEVILIHKYYIQGALYKEALMDIMSKDPDLKGYQLQEFEFLYISKMNPYKPVVWVMPNSLHEHAMKGFVDVFGYEHRGVNDLLEDYYNCKEGRYCEYLQEVYENEGRIMLDGIVNNESTKEQNRDHS